MDTNVYFPWFILLAPLVSAGLIQLFLRKHAGLSATISVATVCFALLASVFVYCGVHHPLITEIPWITLPGLRVPIGLQVDEMSKMMLLIVTGIGALVHIYSLVYMKDDESKARFFGNLSLFMFSMLGIVLANNFAMMFIFWELVGVSSYLLIGHWHTKDTAAAAANKAFLTNRIGDFGFMLGILMVWSLAGSVVFTDIEAFLNVIKQDPDFLATYGVLITTAVLLVFCGAVGKSAQVPLHVWLPDAMEGPTPVSALIHAATMVAAGVFMLARVSFLIGVSPHAQTVIAAVGAITCVFAALIATQQDDIKRILAYSTLSQLGYMVLAIGVAAPGGAMFHLFTHACFKALLFLGAGAIIHELHHEQNIWKMGGLWKRMEGTFVTFGIGFLALIGFPLLSGFFSKDVILVAAHERGPLFFIPALFTVVLTAFYMTRLFVVVFLGEPRSDEARHGRDGPPAMTVPLIILAVLSVFAGYPIVAERMLGHDLWHDVHRVEEFEGVFAVQILSILACFAGAAGGFFLYRGRNREPVSLGIFRNKFYIDEIYAAFIAATQDLLASISAWFDKWILDGLIVRGLSGATWGTGFLLRFFQIGNLQGYAFLFGIGVVALIYYVIFA